MQSWTGVAPQDYFDFYQKYPFPMYSIEEDINGYVYCTFVRPILNEDGEKFDLEHDERWCLEQILTFVYDEDMIIADISALHFNDEVLHNDQKARYFSDDNDWIFLEYLLLKDIVVKGKCEIVMFANAYVTEAYRHQGIFKMMVLDIEEFALRYINKTTEMAEVISLDPDIATYGPDSSDEPYYYTYEKDEKTRMFNALVVNNLGFKPTKFMAVDPKDSPDGTKIWFAWRRTTNVFAYNERVS